MGTILPSHLYFIIEILGIQLHSAEIMFHVEHLHKCHSGVFFILPPFRGYCGGVEAFFWIKTNVRPAPSGRV